MIKISVIIPTHRRPKQLRNLLLSLSQQMNSHLYEVIVISNLLEKNVQKLVHSFNTSILSFQYFYVGQIGVNKARYLGVRKAQGEVLLFLDDDCYLPNSTFLQKVYELHQRHPEFSAIGGRYSLDPLATNVARAYHHNADSWLTQSHQGPEGNAQLLGGNTSYKASVLAHQFKFNENIKFGGAEAELNARLVRAGHRLFLCEEIPVIHNIELSIFGLIRRGLQQGRGHRKKESICGQNIVVPTKANKLPFSIRFYLFLYSFFFRIGYRQALQSTQSSHHKFLPFIVFQELTRLVNWKIGGFIRWRIWGFIRWQVWGFIRWRIWGFIHRHLCGTWNFIRWQLWEFMRRQRLIVFWPLRKIYWMCEYQLLKLRKN